MGWLGCMQVLQMPTVGGWHNMEAGDHDHDGRQTTPARPHHHHPPPPLPPCSENAEMCALHSRQKKELGQVMAALQASYADTRAEAAASYRLMVGAAAAAAAVLDGCQRQVWVHPHLLPV